MRNHNGWYQAIVESSNDPKNQRRITAQVPDVLGKTVSDWARPLTIIDSPLKKGDMVWINFPNGDVRYPTYTVSNDPEWGRIVPTKEELTVYGPDEETKVVLGKEDLTVYGPDGDTKLILSSNSAHLLGPSGGSGVRLDGSLHAQGSGGYTNAYALDFIETSDESQKDDIGPVPFDSIEVIKNAPARKFTYRSSGHTSIGPIRGDLPELVRQGEHHVSVSALIGILWDAVSALSGRVEELEQQVAALIENGANNTLEDGTG